MNFLKTIFTVTILSLGVVSCGGGGGGSEPSLQSQTLNPAAGNQNSSQNNNQNTSEALLVGRVIDGYIEGANVFIDFNWNLKQDEGEPSATTNDEGKYEFSNDNNEFDAINEISLECIMDRPQIVQVPVGAVDLDRGVVDEDFTLYLVPGGISDGITNNPTIYGNLTNISPFTGIFLDFIIEAKNELNITDIELADGCSSEAVSYTHLTLPTN